jgi:hypothetical protein
MIRRLVQQNGRIREAWEAERKYMEVNRERAEEVYKEERALMEEERAEWEAEKDDLLRQIASLQQQVAGMAPKSDGPKQTNLRGAGGWDTSPESVRSSASSQANPPRPTNRSGRDALPRATSVPFQSIADTVLLPTVQPAEFNQPGLSRLTPSKQPESSPFIPIPSNNVVARTISPPPPSNFSHTSEQMSDREDSGSSVPTVDVQEIIPTLEGIPIKATAIQRPTFTDRVSNASGSRPNSRTPSPPADEGSSKRAAKEQTLRVLAANETDRLTLHAGHTPNHSMSSLPTVTASVVTTASSSGDSTPTLQHETELMPSSEPVEPVATANDTGKLAAIEEYDGDDDDITQVVEEDIELKGPLMVRNMPAHDEIFFRKLSDKLQEVSKGTEASIPAVLKDVQEEEAATGSQGVIAQPAGSDGAADVAAADGKDKDKSSPRSSDEEEMEIPLKLKKSNNFGAPFGVFR